MGAGRGCAMLVGAVGCALLLAAGLSGVAAAQEVLPAPAAAFRGQIGVSAAASKSDFPQPVQAPAGRAEHPAGAARRRRLRGDEHVRRAVQHADVHEARRERAEVQPVPHDGPVQPDAGRAASPAATTTRSTPRASWRPRTGFPGYDSVMQKDTATVAEVLKQAGYGTAWFGKNHNVPDWQTSQAGPFDLWPTGLGFDHFYGFIGGDTNQWRPAVTEGTKPIDPYIGNPDYNFDYDMADQAIEVDHDAEGRRPGQAVLLLLRPRRDARPAPPEEGVGREVQGQVRPGLGQGPRGDLRAAEEAGRDPGRRQAHAARPRRSRPGTRCIAEEKKVFARFMEVYAGYLEQTDHNVGRVVKAIEDLGQLDNTLVIYIAGDNGASAEGSLQGLLNEMTFFNGVPEDIKEVLKRADDIGTWKTYNHYPVGWAHAMCTPFQWTKQIASHYGGTRNGMVISWPKGIAAKGELRTQWHHCIDIVPTILEVVGLPQPGFGQRRGAEADRGREHGVHVRRREGPEHAEDAVLRDARQPGDLPRRLGRLHHAAVPPWSPAGTRGRRDHRLQVGTLQRRRRTSRRPTNLADEDAGEAARDAAAVLHRGGQVQRAAARQQQDAAARPGHPPEPHARARSFTFYEGQTRIPEGAVPDIKNKSFRITAEVELAGTGSSSTSATTAAA